MRTDRRSRSLTVTSALNPLVRRPLGGAVASVAEEVGAIRRNARANALAVPVLARGRGVLPNGGVPALVNAPALIPVKLLL